VGVGRVVDAFCFLKVLIESGHALSRHADYRSVFQAIFEHFLIKERISKNVQAIVFAVLSHLVPFLAGSPRGTIWN
jgi:hypothetical protein